MSLKSSDRVIITNVDNDDKYEVIVYDVNDEKIFQGKVDEFYIGLYPHKRPA